MVSGATNEVQLPFKVYPVWPHIHVDVCELEAVGYFGFYRETKKSDYKQHRLCSAFYFTLCVYMSGVRQVTIRTEERGIK